jgi:hypothetical protein
LCFSETVNNSGISTTRAMTLTCKGCH